MAAFDIENGTPVINARVEQIERQSHPQGSLAKFLSRRI